MSFNSILLLLWRQFSSKWGRFLLASGGIMIGIWAISLTTSASIGLSFTLIDSVNSQPRAKLISLSPASGTKFDQSEINKIKTNNPSFAEVAPTINYSFYIGNNKTAANTISFETRAWLEFLDINRLKIIGSQNLPQKNEIIACFQCGTTKLNEKLGFQSANQMLGQSITLTDTENVNAESISYKIIGVIDDSSEKVNYNQDTFYINPNTNPQFSQTNFDELQGYLQSFEQLKPTLNDLKNQNYQAYSNTVVIIESVQTLFNLITIIMGLFGLIALVASIFGIVNVMTISVLERKKEIGILKSLGARNKDIFTIFLLESLFIGFIGWLLGILLALGSGVLITTLFKFVVSQNAEIAKNFGQLNIQSFNPVFPYWLILGTLAIAIFFTTISGLLPSIKAANQNPVDVLRGE
jgi:ABC-type lipoprotein release transport system permease subunit